MQWNRSIFIGAIFLVLFGMVMGFSYTCSAQDLSKADTEGLSEKVTLSKVQYTNPGMLWNYLAIYSWKVDNTFEHDLNVKFQVIYRSNGEPVGSKTFMVEVPNGKTHIGINSPGDLAEGEVFDMIDYGLTQIQTQGNLIDTAKVTLSVVSAWPVDPKELAKVKSGNMVAHEIVGENMKVEALWTNLIRHSNGVAKSGTNYLTSTTFWDGTLDDMVRFNDDLHKESLAWPRSICDHSISYWQGRSYMNSVGRMVERINALAIEKDRKKLGTKDTAISVTTRGLLMTMKDTHFERMRTMKKVGFSIPKWISEFHPKKDVKKEDAKDTKVKKEAKK